MQDRDHAIKIVTTIHFMLVRLHKEAPELKAMGWRRWFQPTAKPEMFRLERNLQLTERLFYLEALVVDRSVHPAILRRLHEKVIDVLGDIQPIHNGRNIIRVGHLAVILDIIDHNGDTVYGLQVLRHH